MTGVLYVRLIFIACLNFKVTAEICAFVLNRMFLGKNTYLQSVDPNPVAFLSIELHLKLQLLVLQMARKITNNVYVRLLKSICALQP